MSKRPSTVSGTSNSVYKPLIAGRPTAAAYRRAGGPSPPTPRATFFRCCHALDGRGLTDSRQLAISLRRFGRKRPAFKQGSASPGPRPTPRVRLPTHDRNCARYRQDRRLCWWLSDLAPAHPKRRYAATCRATISWSSLRSEDPPSRRSPTSWVRPPRSAPSTTTWYYISRRTEQWAFLPKEVAIQKIVVLYFDERTLQRVEEYNEDDIRQVAHVERETPTAGHSMTVLEQLFGNLGRFNK